ncbi:MAG: M24 family metallopeptidase [Dehalococcoidia bacterium]|nr:M24 family metallopeptidase [Dehalococcoidia bacterium]
MPAGERPNFVPAPPLIEDLRMVKDASELARMQRAIDVGDAALAQVSETIDTSMTERQVADAIAAAIRRNGGDGIAFDTIVAAGPWGARPHASPREEPIARDVPIVIDMGARVDGYCSDLTRTLVAGELSPRFKAVYEVVREAQRNAIERVESGMSGKVAHELAAGVIERHGFGDDFGHGLGHGVGLDVHESPYLGRSSNDTLGEGMVFTIEPGIYLSGEGGVRIEDIVVLENGRARVLSHAPKQTYQGAI